MTQKPLVSACIICYNQQDYIAKCLEGALMQKLDLPYEVVIADDCSTDSTLEVVKKYAKQNSRIRVLNSKTNLGVNRNWERAINACKGSFVALCEGDDYWTDKYKLAKQLSVLENNTSLSCCFSDASLLVEKSVKLRFNSYLKENDVDTSRTTFGLSELSISNFIPTCAVMFRKNGELKLPQEYFESPYADWFVHIYNAVQGGFYLINEKTAVYRLHGNGAFGQIPQDQRDKTKLRCLSLLYQGFLENPIARSLLHQSVTSAIDGLATNARASGNSFRFLALKVLSKMHHLSGFSTFAKQAGRI